MKRTNQLVFTALLLLCALPLKAAEQIQTYNASELEWTLTGYMPNAMTSHLFAVAPFGPMKAPVPGSVQMALLQNNEIENWNYGQNNLNCEWVENRQWVYETIIPDQWLQNGFIRLKLKGLDDRGKVTLNGMEILKFDNAFVPYTVDLNKHLKSSSNKLQITFEESPRYLGQILHTSQVKDFKPRFYYGWDWIKRVVQIGIWDDILIEVVPDKEFSEIDNLQIIPSADKKKDIGELFIKAEYANRFYSKNKAKVVLTDMQGKELINAEYPAVELKRGLTFPGLKIKRWYPNGFGEQPLYTLKCSMLDKNGTDVQTIVKTIGFKHEEWLLCKNAPAEADPLICSINGQPVFMQGINWTPIRPNFADLKEEDYDKLLSTYKSLGLNTIRIWGGSFPEKIWLYELCDKYGIMVWQDFPISSAGMDNYPPTDPVVIRKMSDVARHYVDRLHSHVSLIVWCGGNELYEIGDWAPVTNKHPMIKMFEEVVTTADPKRRFLIGSPSGPSIWGGLPNFGKGINWETHGPWTPPYDVEKGDYSMKPVREYWEKNDALLMSEVGVSGASSTYIIEKYAGKYNPFPANNDNVLWKQFCFWTDWYEYEKLYNKEPADLKTYVEWSQQKQAEALSIALASCKNRFPQCAGFLIWMGHDSYPATANTSILDFEGNPKPAAIAVSKIWKQKQNNYD